MLAEACPAPVRYDVGSHARSRNASSPNNPTCTGAFLNIRVADIETVYRKWSSKGAQFLTPPIDMGSEIRCYLRDPDGYLIEVGQATRGLP